MELKKLNLSHNLIEFIGQDSFRNLISLKLLDLSFNRLLSIENNLFNGLVNLNDLDYFKELHAFITDLLNLKGKEIKILFLNHSF